MADASRFDIVIVGSGFAATFFLKRALQSPDVRRVLVLERGNRHSYQWQIEHGHNNNFRKSERRPHRESGLKGKWWDYNIGFGGGSNCWWTNAMRIHPADFQIRTLYGVGEDWPISYSDLESYYCDAEEDMLVSGDNSSDLIFPRSRSYPQPRHRYSQIGAALKSVYPDETFAMPTTRGRVAAGRRGACCAISRCHLCPNHAKFTIVEEMSELFDDPRVTLVLQAEAQYVETRGGNASAVVYLLGGRQHRAEADFVALAANGIFNPFILLKSKITDGPVGKGITEQIPIKIRLNFHSLKNQGFSSHIAAVNYSFSNGSQRAHASGGFLEITKDFDPRPNIDKWNNQARCTMLLGDFRSDQNFVGIDPENPEQPLVHFENWTPYAYAGLDYVKSKLEDFLSPLGIEEMEVDYGHVATHHHIECSTPMGNDPNYSVVDADLVHHRIRNLVVLGSGAFPTSPGTNPTLTIAALSLRSANRVILGRR